MADVERKLFTTRLELESLVPAHASLLFNDLQDERLYRFHAGRPQSEEQLRGRFERWLARRSPDGSEVWLNYAIKRKSDGSYVGWLQATVAGDKALIGYDIFANYWRQGFAKEACSELLRFLKQDYEVRTIAAVVDTENLASIRLLESLGFAQVWTGPSEDMPGRRDHRYELH